MSIIEEFKLNRLRKKISKNKYNLIKLINKGKIDLSQEEFANLYVEYVLNQDLKLYTNDNTHRFLNAGITEDFLFTNPTTRQEMINEFIEGIQDNYKEFLFPPSLVDRILSDPSIVSEIKSRVNLNEILEQQIRYVFDEFGPKKINILSILKKLGADFNNENFLKKITEPLVNLQAELYDAGILTPSDISNLYHYRYNKYKEWLQNPERKNIPSISIDENLPILNTDTLSNFYRNLDKQTGNTDILKSIFLYYKDSNYTKKHDIFGEKEETEIYEEWLKTNGIYYTNPEEEFAKSKDSIRGALFTKDGILTDQFYSSHDNGSMLEDILYYNYEGHCRLNSKHLSVDNIINILMTRPEAVDQKYIGLLRTYQRIEDDNVRELFIRHATDSHYIFDVNEFYTQTGEIKEGFYKNILSNEDAAKILESLDPNWQNHYTKEEKKYLEFRSYLKDNRYYIRYIDNFYEEGKVEKYFKDGKLTRELIEKMLWPQCENNINVIRTLLLQNDEAKQLLTPSEKEYLYFYIKYLNNETIRNIKKEEIEDLFDEKDKSKLVRFLFYNFEIEILNDINLSPQEYLNEKELLIIEEYKNVPPVLQRVFKDYIREELDNIDIDKIKFVSDLFQKIILSNASELSSHIAPLARTLLTKENPIEALSKIEDVFIRNNLPEVAKLFLTFQILHPDEALVSHFNIDTSEIISPVLQSSSGNIKKIKTIIFSDLLKSTIKSNNRSIQEYIESIEVGYDLFKKLEQNEIAFNDLSDKEKQIITIFKDHLITLYENMDKTKYPQLNLTGDITTDLHIIKDSFNPTDLHNLPDRIVRSFGYFAGIKSLQDLKNIIEKTVLETDARNRNNSTYSSFFTLHEGDFIKGLGTDGVMYLNNILSNGSVSKEFLGDSAGSDATPLDTDLSRILEEPKSITEAIGKTISSSYGPIWFVLKNDDRFNITRDSNGTYENKTNDYTKLEMFQTLSAGHYGIRTGFASSDIDFIIADKEDKRIYVEIVKNGFYIPVIERESGKLIFTPQDYDLLRSKMQGLSHYGIKEYEFSESITNSETIKIAESLNQNETEVKEKRDCIIKHIKNAVARLNLKLKSYIDGDLTEGYVELIDTGSTGRGTNMLGDGDFDLLMRIDNKIIASPEKMNELRQAIKEELGTEAETIGTGDFRLKGIKLPELKTPLDIDISFVQRTNKVKYSSDMAITDRLSTIRKIDPEKYQLVIANIILAKKVLKAYQAYKPNRGDIPQGGLGGIGIENWILQNGGSFEEAARRFLELSEGKEYEEFKKEFQVWDFGENHFAQKSNRYPHDDFVYNNMSAAGYENMKKALKEYIKSLEMQQNIEETIQRRV